MTELVVLGPLLRVGKHFVGLGEFLELVLGTLVTRIFIGMILDGLFAEGLLDLGFRGVSMDTENLVIIAFIAVCQSDILFTSP